MRELEVNSTPERKIVTSAGETGHANRDTQSLAPALGDSLVASEGSRRLTRLRPANFPHHVLSLQRQYGNRSVQRMLTPARSDDAEKVTATTSAAESAAESPAKDVWQGRSDADLATGQNPGLGPGMVREGPRVSALRRAVRPGVRHGVRREVRPGVRRGVQREVQLEVQREIQREGAEEGNGGGSAPPALTEHLGGTLWATDASGKTLPPSLDDIAQGGVNDCFLFAALSAIVNADPKQIENMIQDNGGGTYTVTFTGIGFFSIAKQTVSADFAVGKHGNLTARKALWPLIIEKAYEQQKGGIAAVDQGGNAGNAIKDMTDEGANRFDPREKTADYVMGKVAQGKEKKWPMTILSPKQDDASLDKKALAEGTPGLHFWHTYAIIDLDAAGNRIKLFNPWGHDHPNGDGWMNVDKVRTFFIEIDISG